MERDDDYKHSDYLGGHSRNARRTQELVACREKITALEAELAETRAKLARTFKLLGDALDLADVMIGPGCDDGPEGWRTKARAILDAAVKEAGG